MKLSNVRFPGLLAILAFAALLLTGCGGGGHSPGPPTVDDLSSWLDDAGECENVETSVTRLPVSPSRSDQVAPADLRFENQAELAATIICGGVNGYISYFRFPSARARAAAVAGRDGLISNELFCAKGAELVVNDLFGYDNTSDFCEKLGFPIHRPTHVESAAAIRRHHLEETARRLYAHAANFPLTNVYCESAGGDLEFECGNFVGGGLAKVTLAETHGHYVIVRTAGI